MSKPIYSVKLPSGTGKACAGCGKTLSLQVVEDWGVSGYIIKKIFRFKNGDIESMKKAFVRATEHARILNSSAR